MGNVLTCVTNGYNVGISREYVSRLVEDLGFDPHKATPVMTPGVVHALRRHENEPLDQEQMSTLVVGCLLWLGLERLREEAESMLGCAVRDGLGRASKAPWKLQGAPQDCVADEVLALMMRRVENFE